MKKSVRVMNGEGKRERILTRVKPELRETLRSSARRLGLSESRLVEMGLERLFSGKPEEDPVSSLIKNVDELNKNIARLCSSVESQGELLGHFIFQHFTTAPMVRRGEEQAVKIAATQRFVEFLTRIQSGLEVGKSIFELGQSRVRPPAEAVPRLPDEL